MPTIRDVARACGVSPMTVSYVLNNPDRVQEKTRARVLSAMREMGYRPPSPDGRRAPAAGSDEETERRPTFGLVCARWERLTGGVSYLSRLLPGILDGANDDGANVTLFTHHIWEEPAHRSLRRYCDGRCDGLLMVSPHRGHPLVAALRERGTPFVLIGATGDRPDDPCADVDNVSAAREVVRHLIGLGHRRIAYLPGQPNRHAPHERGRGWREELQAHGLPAGDGLCPPGDWSRVSGAERARTLLSLPPGERPTAIFAVNDGVAEGALDAARALGLRVPEDVSVVGFDDMPQASAADPPLTTVLQPYAEIGRRAVALLSSRLRAGGAGGGAPAESRALLPGTLVVRGSTGPAPVG